MTCVELRAALKKRKLKVGGLKAVLIKRLDESLKEEESAQTIDSDDEVSKMCIDPPHVPSPIADQVEPKITPLLPLSEPEEFHECLMDIENSYEPIESPKNETYLIEQKQQQCRREQLELKLMNGEEKFQRQVELFQSSNDENTQNSSTPHKEDESASESSLGLVELPTQEAAIQVKFPEKEKSKQEANEECSKSKSKTSIEELLIVENNPHSAQKMTAATDSRDAIKMEAMRLREAAKFTARKKFESISMGERQSTTSGTIEKSIEYHKDVVEEDLSTSNTKNRIEESILQNEPSGNDNVVVNDVVEMSSVISAIPASYDVSNKLAQARLPPKPDNIPRKPTNLVSGVHSFASLVPKNQPKNKITIDTSKSQLMSLKLAEKSRLAAEKKQAERQKRKELLRQKYSVNDTKKVC